MIDLSMIPINELVPHANRMCWLSRALHGDDDQILSEAVLDEQHIMFQNQQIGAWVGIELMAQTVAAWAGWKARLKNQPPPIGFLLGSRDYRSCDSHLPLGMLQIHAQRHFQASNGLAQFACEIRQGNTVVSSGTMTVFEPDNVAAFLQGMI